MLGIKKHCQEGENIARHQKALSRIKSNAIKKHYILWWSALLVENAPGRHDECARVVQECDWVVPEYTVGGVLKENVP